MEEKSSIQARSFSPSRCSTPGTSCQKRKPNECESPSSYNSPTKKRLARKVIELSSRIDHKNRQIKNLKEKTRYMKKQIASLKSILTNLQKKNLVLSEQANILENIGVTNKELLKRQILRSKKAGCIIRKKYSPELRTFALTLQFYSTKAYNYVRQTFQTCLPSVKTLSKWYQSIDGKPGFTKESFEALKNKSKQYQDKILCTLIFDEIKIKNKVEYHPLSQRTFGYVNFGGNIDTDSNHECTEALVFMVMALNKRFKVPIGYFLTNGTNAHQKVNLVLQAIQLCHENNITVKALTFDGCPTNLSMAKLLGCNFSPENLKTTFTHPKTKTTVHVFLDPAHMLKLVRNAFESYREFKNSEGNIIRWEYIQFLQELQDREQFHLANKLRLSHIQFKQNIMKVKLASQLFSRSVATALQFCKNELKLQDFRDVDATVDMIFLLNDLFDILDSKVHGHGFKQALNEVNSTNVNLRLEECRHFLSTVTMVKNQKEVRLIKSPRYTGFLGFCVAIESAKSMYLDVISNYNSCIKYLPFHKISQDHIELLFANIRSHGGSNDNPTPRLFESIYKKIIIHTELVQVSTGNCVPLEQISILNCSSAIKRINLTSTVHDTDNLNDHLNETENQDELYTAWQSIVLSEFAEKAIEYIAGFVASSLINCIKCKVCVGALITLNENKNSLIAYRDKGGLIYPSQTVLRICRRCELIVKIYHKDISNGKPNKRDILTNKTLASFIGENLFSEISFHQFYSENTNHLLDLAMSVMNKYISTRLAFLTKSSDVKPKFRRIYTKLIHFKNE